MLASNNTIEYKRKYFLIILLSHWKNITLYMIEIYLIDNEDKNRGLMLNNLKCCSKYEKNTKMKYKMNIFVLYILRSLLSTQSLRWNLKFQYSYTFANSKITLINFESICYLKNYLNTTNKS